MKLTAATSEDLTAKVEEEWSNPKVSKGLDAIINEQGKGMAVSRGKKERIQVFDLVKGMA